MKFLFLLFLFTIGSLSNYAREERVSKMPNLIILLADDLGYGELGCQGNKEIPTPHIDGIAKRAFASLKAMSRLPTAVPPVLV